MSFYFKKHKYISEEVKVSIFNFIKYYFRGHSDSKVND